MKKNIVCITIAIALCLGLCGCAEDSSNKEVTEVHVTESQETVDETTDTHENELKPETMAEIPGDAVNPVDLTGKWKMEYGTMSSDPQIDLAQLGLSYFEFLDNGNVKFQFSFEYIQYFSKETGYEVVDGDIGYGLEDNGWYAIIDADNEIDDTPYDHYTCSFTAYEDALVAVISGDGESTVYTCYYKKSE